MIQHIVTNEDEGGVGILKTKCEPFVVDVEHYQANSDLFTDLLDTAQYASKRRRMGGCLGLSANQLGQCKTGFVMKFGDKFIPVMNPVVLAVSDQTDIRDEACLSLPNNDPVSVRRHKWIKLEWIDPFILNTMKRKFHGLDARIVQHELDHANGVLI